jgi:ribose transport system permease protein
MKSLAPDSAPRFSRTWEYLRSVLGPFAALLCVVLLFTVADAWFARGTFGTVRNLQTVAVQTCVVAVAALGMTIVIISGGIDLSAGTALSLAATVLAWGLREDIAFRMAHGDNFVSASRKLEQAQRELGKGSDSPQAVYTERLGKLKAILRSKIEDAQTRAAEAADMEDRGRFEQNVATLEAKLARLDEQELVFRSNSLWEDGVYNAGASAPLAVILALAAGMAAGLLNGLLISSLRVIPFIVTLGTMTVYLGLGNLLAGSIPIRPSTQHQVPGSLGAILRNTPDAYYLGFPYGVWLALFLALLLAILLRWSVFGRYVFALGSNEATARLCGVNVELNKVAVYTLAGLFVGMAGVYQFSRLQAGDPQSGLGMELRIIAAVVIGGGSLSGGRGAVLGTLTGAAIMSVIASGCTQLEVPNPVQDIILGTIIIGAVTVDQFRQRRWNTE